MAELALFLAILSLLISVGHLSAGIALVLTGRRNSGRIVESTFTEVASSGPTTRQPTNPAIFNASEQPIPDFIPAKIKSAPLPKGGFGRKPKEADSTT